MRVGGEVVRDEKLTCAETRGSSEGTVLQVGKRRYARLVLAKTT